MKHKIVTRGARRATRYGGSLTKSWKRAIHRAYRRRIRIMRHDDDANYEPPLSVRITDRDVV